MRHANVATSFLVKTVGAVTEGFGTAEFTGWLVGPRTKF
jgi:hypothetical protein